MKKVTLAAAVLLFLAMAAAVFVFRYGEKESRPSGHVRLHGGGMIKTLDPALADDLPSRNLAGAFYDTLLEYKYLARPYELKPSMLAEMPEISADGKVWKLRLRDDLVFPEKSCPGSVQERKVTAQDVKFSFLRLLDGRLHSPVAWLLRGKFPGEEDFRTACEKSPTGDYSAYDAEFPGIVIKNTLELELHFLRPEPNFAWLLAMPNLGIISRCGFMAKSGNIAESPAGSGAFTLGEWRRNFRVVLRRNPEYRREFFTGAVSEADRRRPLPLAEVIELPLVRQPMTGWLMFLQGELDNFALDKDLSDVASGGELPEELKKRGVQLIRQPEFEVRYIGFNFSDPLTGGNPALRQAIAAAVDHAAMERFFNYQLLGTAQPIPPGIAGHDPELLHGKKRTPDLDKARKLLGEAGFPGGIDPATGAALVLTLDQAGNSTGHRQYGELFAGQMAKIGIKIVSQLNSRPRFIEKLRQGKVQLFRYSWVGDYPEGENFLQLFYSGNSGTSNRTNYSNPLYDRVFAAALLTPSPGEKTKLYRKATEIINKDTVWIYEGIPLSYLLTQPWLENYYAHDFPFVRWKYLSASAGKRREAIKNIKPLSLSKMRGSDKNAETVK